MILLSSPLKMTPPPPETMASTYIPFSRNGDSQNQNSQFKKFEKNLLSASVGDENP